VDTRFACFYLTGQLESIQQKFRLARVVFVVSKPHVFNLTGQLASKSLEFPTVEQVAASESQIPLASDVLPSTYCLNEEDFVVSLLSGDKTGVASSAGSLDEDAPLDALAEQDMELHYYRSHKASFSVQAFPPHQKLTAR
jgi:hypothetical protein